MKLKEDTLFKWDERFVMLAEYISCWSKDPNTKVGAVIVKPEGKQIISTGYNGIARGVEEYPGFRDSRKGGEKYHWFAHAERNAIYNCARFGISTMGADLYLNIGVPCTGCAIAIIQAGIRTVYAKAGCKVAHSERWADETSRSRQMFKEAGVQMILYTVEEDE